MSVMTFPKLASRPLVALAVDARPPDRPGDGGDWHARRLAGALRARGAEVATFALPDCRFDTTAAHGVVLSGPTHPTCGARLPDAVLVRSIGAGNLEQITFRLGILHALEALGVRVWNRAQAIERAVDKSTATFRFKHAGLPVPPTVTVEGRARAAAAVARLGLPAVSKPLFGAQGVGIRRLEASTDLPAPEDVGDVYYMQALVGDRGPTYEDWRVLVSGSRVVAAMARRSASWITNVHQGGRPVAHVPDSEMAGLACAAMAAVGADYGGVDLIRGADGRLAVLEVNTSPAWRGLQTVTPVDIAAAVADDLLAALGCGDPLATTTPAAPHTAPSAAGDDP
jgi:RimK family alpha-L-glutamate ligase